MKTKPILFSTEMIHANLEGRKSQTRRVIDEKHSGFLEYAFKNKKNLADWISKNAKYQMGDILWVRESWQVSRFGIYFSRARCPEHEVKEVKWRPSIHMPKKAARQFLKVINIRVERLQDISENDAIAEGIERFENSLFNETRYRDYTDGKRRDKDFNLYPEEAKRVGYSHFGGNPWPDWRDPISSFQTLWQSINGKKIPWESNPFVWVYEYEIIEKPENFLTL